VKEVESGIRRGFFGFTALIDQRLYVEDSSGFLAEIFD